MSKGKIHPATLPFQGIRIEVNDELGVLRGFLILLEIAKFKNCIVAIISFHSLEDRIVKNYFKNGVNLVFVQKIFLDVNVETIML